VVTPPDTDEFNGSRLGLQWQWQANPQPGWAFPSAAYGFLRLYNIPPPEGFVNFWQAPNLLLQKFPAPEFSATTKIKFTPRADGERAGLVVMGADYGWIGLEKRGDELVLTQATCLGADSGGTENKSASVPLTSTGVILRARVANGGIVRFGYSIDGTTFVEMGSPLTAKPGRWVGAKVGLFALGTGTAAEFGYADFDWFRVEPFKAE
jgi:beta-xylosidase